jgi:peptidoglycan/xylan/chitin deacetylase (PgdA/CDA1 family)
VTSKKDMLAMLIARTGLVRIVSRTHDAVWHDLRVLAYHRVLPRQDVNRFAYDIELVSAWEDEFDWQVGHLAKHYAVITPSELARLADAGKPPPRNAAMITFDDGYRDNHDIAFPILRRHGVAATMFVTTGYLDQPDLYWFDKLSYAIKASQVGQLTLPDGTALALGDDLPARQKACETALRSLKSVSDQLRRDSVSNWLAQLGVATPWVNGSVHCSMSWAEVKALADNGMEIGSHSVTHPVLSTVADDLELRREVFDSKLAIEAHTKRPVTALAYPVGGPKAYNDRVIQVVREAGYRYAFTYTSGLNRPQAMNPFAIKRLAVERYTSRDRFSAMLAAPPMFV